MGYGIGVEVRGLPGGRAAFKKGEARKKASMRRTSYFTLPLHTRSLASTYGGLSFCILLGGSEAATAGEEELLMACCEGKSLKSSSICELRLP